jgi:hypothetical protein
MSSPSNKEQLLKAKALIQQKRYDEARKLLKRLDDPKAKEWLLKLNTINPPKRRFRVLYIIGLLVTFALGMLIGTFFVSKRTDNSAQSAALIPTQLVLPNTPTSSYTPTATVTPSSTSTPTTTPTLTNTATPTHTPTITDTPTPTKTPLPTQTPKPTNTLTPTFAPQVGRIGPIHDDLRQEDYSVEVQLMHVDFSPGQGVEKPKSGNVYAIVEVNVHNLGPDSLHSLGGSSFQIKDANGAIRDQTFIFFRECSFDFVDLTAGGSISGCVAFEVPNSGSLELIYAPYQYEGLKPGRYISFQLR